MRVAKVIFAGSVAALIALATPALARHSDVKAAVENAAASPCHAYQMAPDRSWKQLPCKEEGTAARPARKSAAHSTGAESVTR